MTESITQELREVFLEYMDKVDALARENVQLNNIIIDGRAENERLIQECRNVDKYKKALEDIKVIADKAVNSHDCYIYMYAGKMYCKPIIEKIDEVLNEGK